MSDRYLGEYAADKILEMQQRALAAEARVAELEAEAKHLHAALAEVRNGISHESARLHNQALVMFDAWIAEEHGVDPSKLTES